MSTIGTKRLREDSEESPSNKRLKIADLEPDSALSVFQIPELVENIVKYLLKSPETIVFISRISKMHYDLIHCTAMWIRLGFSAMICPEEKLSDNTLNFLLVDLRLELNNEKIRRLQLHSIIFKRIPSPQPAVDLEEEEMPQFIANNYLTDEAAIVLLRIIERTYIRYFTLRELVDWLERDPEDTKALRWSSHGSIEKLFDFPIRKWDNSLAVCVQYFADDTRVPNKMTDILQASRVSESQAFVGRVKRYTLANKNKTLLFIYSYLEDCEGFSSFVKLDRSTNKIECCGELKYFVGKKFGGDFTKALNYLCEVDRSGSSWGHDYLFYNQLCNSYFRVTTDKRYAPYVAEDIQFARTNKLI